MSYSKDIQYKKFCAYGFLKNLDFYNIFLMIFFREVGLSFLEIGLLYAIREITINIFEIPSGIFADIIGRKKIMLFAFTNYIISFCMFFAFVNTYSFMVAFVFFGIGEASRSGTHKAMILTYLNKKGWDAYKTDYYGKTRSWSQKGSALSSIIGGAIVFFTGEIKWVFLVSIIPYIIDFLLIMSYPNWLNREKHSSLSLKKSFATHFEHIFQSFKKLSTLKLLLNTSIYTSYYKVTKDYLQPMLVSFALSAPILSSVESGKKTAIIIGITYFFIFLITSKASSNAGAIQAKLNKKSTAINTLLFIGLVLGTAAGLAYSYDITLIAILLFVGILIIQNLRRPISMSFISDQFDHKIMATILSADSQFSTIAVAILAPIIGLLADMVGAGTSIAIISSVLLIIFIPFRLKTLPNN